MRFIKAHMHGFGKWVDTSFTFNEQGLTCIVGDNESGKSTFQTFISFMLFGLPPKKRAFYRPKTSGTLGGELVIQLDDGEKVTIQRFDGHKNGAATCILESGEEQSEEWLQTVLKGMTAEIFASTFQFSTEDLYAFQQIEVDQIGEVLLNASISGASHVREVEEELEQKKDDLFKPRGTRPKVNEQLQRLDTIQQQLNKHAHIQEEHQALTEQITQKTDEINNLQKNINDTRKDRITWEQVQRALPYIQKYEQAEKELAQTEVISLNEDGPHLLTEQKRLQQEYMSNKELIQKNIDRYIDEMNNISLLDKHIVEEGKAILQEKEEWTYNVRFHNDLKRERDHIQTEIDTKVHPYIRILTPETIDALDMPPFIDKKWKEFARKAAQLDDQRLDQAEAVKHKGETLKSVEEKITKASINILPKDEYKDLKETLSLDEQTRSNEWYMQTLAQEKSEQKKRIHKNYQQSVKILLGTNVVALLFGVIAFLSSIPWLYYGAIVSAVFGWVQWYYKRTEYARVDNEQQLEVPSIDPLEKEKIISLQEQLDAHIRATESVAFLTRQKEEAEYEYAHTQRALKDIETEEQQLNVAIEHEVLRYPFLDRIELSDWEDIGHLLQDIQSLQLQLRDVHRQIEQNKQSIELFEQKVRTWWNTIFHESNSEPIRTLLSTIEQSIHEDMKARQRHEKVYFEKEEAIEHKRQMNEHLRQVEQTMKAIFQEAHVTSEEGFIQQHEIYLEQQQNINSMNEAKQQLIQIFSLTTWDAYVHQEIEAHTVEYELQNNHQRMKEYEKELEEARSKLATATAERTHVEQTDSLTYSERMHMFEIEKEKLQELSKTWAIYEVTSSILQQTKQTYMRKHLDAVIRRATEHFSYITNHRYIRVHVDIENEHIRVENNKHTYYNMEELSKGTRDQLYIAIRIAMSEHIQKNTPKPYIFDDSFVHFDKKRTERMIDRIIYLSRQHQVVLFTCKDEIEQMVSTYSKENDISIVRIDESFMVKYDET